jgi:YidC/Oxa1 family membrane protein insertase
VAYTGKDVVVETPLYRAVFTETGARLKSFVLENFRETIDKNSPGKELVKTSKIEELPLPFNFVNNPVAALNLAPYIADQPSLKVASGETKPLTFRYEAPGWLRITRQCVFYADKYLIDLIIRVENLSSQAWENSPTLSLINLPISTSGGSRYTFQGPALFSNDELQEVKIKKIKGETQVPGPIDWIAYTSQYFTMAVVPIDLAPNHGQLKALDTDRQMVETTFIGPKITLQPGAQQEFRYKLYLGPRKRVT